MYLQDPEFDRLIQRAVIANLDLQVAAARVSEARALAWSRKIWGQCKRLET